MPVGYCALRNEFESLMPDSQACPLFSVILQDSPLIQTTSAGFSATGWTASCSFRMPGQLGAIQEVALRQATALDFETAIREMEDLDKLRRFMGKMIGMRLQRANYDTHFDTATEHFVEACRAIVNDTASPRLASLVKRLFDETPLASELAP